jgi:hypothetical protein
MKRPTITKLQAINALVEIKRRDYAHAQEEFRIRLMRAEYDLLGELANVIRDPERIALLVELNKDAPKEAKEIPVEYDLTGTIILDATFLPEVADLVDRLDATRRTHPEYFNEGAMRTMLEDKLTGCDPESLLSVPDNVANMRALLNGLQLLPTSYESLSA